MSSKGAYRTDRLAGSIVEQAFRALVELGGQATAGQIGRKINVDARRVDRHMGVEARDPKGSVVRVGKSCGTPLADRVWRRR